MTTLPTDERADTGDIRWAVNVLLETIAAKFEASDTWDIWKSDAADLVRSFKHDLAALPVPAQAQAVAGWQDIATAPKTSGKHLLMFGDGPGFMQCQFIGCWWEHEDGRGEWQETYNSRAKSVSPTHWKPLDPPPALVAEERARAEPTCDGSCNVPGGPGCMCGATPAFSSQNRGDL